MQGSGHRVDFWPPPATLRSKTLDMPLNKRILLDMDGVLVDFFGEALGVHGREELAEGWPERQWDMASVMGMSGAEFWKPINDLGVEFWANLSWYPWAEELVELCEEAGGFVIASTPSRRSTSSMGKVMCLQERFGHGFRDYMLGPHKQLMAGSGLVLIDDSDDQVEAFREAGGEAILFPQRWNRDHALLSERLERVREGLLVS